MKLKEKARRLCLASCVSVALLVSAGCVTAPSKSGGESSAEGISIVENESVDLDVRRDFKAAVSLMQEDRNSEAIELLKKVIQGSQNNSAPYINIAIAYTRIGDMAAAEQNLKRALEINPKHPVAMNEYALLMRKVGRYDEAKQSYERLLAQYPQFLPARKNLGILCDLYLKDRVCAVEQYELYSAANPADDEVNLWLTALKQ